MEDGCNMKKTLYIIIGLIAATCLSCKKDESVADIKTVAQEVVGEWHLIKETCEGVPVESTAEVYLHIKADSSFELYQKSGTQTRFYMFNGTCYSEDGKLIGQYNDGTSWGAVYLVTFADGKMILSTFDKMGEMTFESKSLSVEEKNNANIAVKSSAAESPIL